MELRRIPSVIGYSATEDGAIYSHHRFEPFPLKHTAHTQGYRQVNVKTATGFRTRLVHTLVLEAWVGKRPPNMVTNHKNGDKTDNRLENLEYVTQTENFFSKYGTKAIVLARFVPIVRTFTPFVAGIGKMEYRKKFMPYDIFGGILWISSMSLAGYVLGSHEWVKKHFEAVVIGIVLLSISPMVFAYLKHVLKKIKS